MAKLTKNYGWDNHVTIVIVMNFSMQYYLIFSQYVYHQLLHHLLKM